jgi:hypothetical protein
MGAYRRCATRAKSQNSDDDGGNATFFEHILLLCLQLFQVFVQTRIWILLKTPGYASTLPFSSVSRNASSNKLKENTLLLAWNEYWPKKPSIGT